ncbi:MAG: ABC transporter permease, partial [Rhodothermales bacterium]
MLKNYLKSTYRNLRQHPGYSLINLSGLAVGMACCLLIALYLNDELSFDRYHENGEEIHRVVIDYTTNGNRSEQGYTQGLLAPVLASEIPEVVTAVRMTNSGGLLGYEDKVFNESSFLLTDPSIFSVFSFSLLRGDPETALVEPYSIVLTPPIAEKYFGSEDPMGKVLRYNNDRQLTVTGIVAVPPAQSHFTFEGLVSMSTIDNAEAPSWMFQEWLSTFVQTYVLLTDKSAAPIVESKMADIVEREAGAMMSNSNRRVDLYLESLSDIYLTSERDGLGTRGSLTNLYLFGFIAGFILLIACINFMNLATARAMGRAREVGVRKSLGAARSQLVFQFLGEAIFVSFLAMATALLLVKLSLAPFNLLAGKSLVVSTLFQPAAIALLA